MAEETVIVGGLGGGGDGGGALPIALELGRLGVRTVFVSFVNLRQGDVINAEQVKWGLLKINPGSYTYKRFFEPRIASMGYETYCLCLREPRKALVEAYSWLAERFNAKVSIHVDLGGDSLVFGDEPRMGTWRADMKALSVIAEMGKRGIVRPHLAVGVLGGEGGGEISQNHLAENVLRLLEEGAYYGYYEPEGELRKEVISRLSELLRAVPSGMLSFYLESLRGKTGLKRYNMLYLRGMYEIKDYYKYHFFFDPVGVCSKSWLCQQMMRKGYVSRRELEGRSIRRRPPTELEQAVKELLKKKVDLEKLIRG